MNSGQHDNIPHHGIFDPKLGETGMLRDIVIVSNTVLETHGPGQCTPPCTIHSPSDHHMKDWPQWWNGEKGMMYRVCQHGDIHPDIDDIKLSLARSLIEMLDLAEHRCCPNECCVPTEFKAIVDALIPRQRRTGSVETGVVHASRNQEPVCGAELPALCGMTVTCPHCTRILKAGQDGGTISSG